METATLTGPDLAYWVARANIKSVKGATSQSGAKPKPTQYGERLAILLNRTACECRCLMVHIRFRVRELQKTYGAGNEDLHH